MVSAEELPATLSINAYRGGPVPVVSPLAERKKRWVLQNSPPAIRPYLAPTPADLSSWRDPRVGWGLILADDPRRTPEELSGAGDAPEPIQRLVRERNGGVFRFVPGSNAYRYLRDYKNGCDVSTASSSLGIDTGCLPYYLLIYGTPADVPWTLQYTLNAGRAVGRLALEDGDLANYVEHLLNGWESEQPGSLNSVVWSTNHGHDDITSLIGDVIARPLQEKFAHDASSDIGVAWYHGDEGATAANLIDSLKELCPRIIVTTSHGSTYPDDGHGSMEQTLGAPIDQDLRALVPRDVLSSWDPAGAFWYAHACCSAGSDSETLFDGLVEKDSEIDVILKGVAKSGPMVAPLPSELLAAKKPLKAFIGHVEPTFDWSLRDPMTRQRFGTPIVTALYDNLCSHMPIGHALRTVYQRLAGLYTSYDGNLRMYNTEGRMLPGMLRDLLVARDVQSMVILGDPTVAL